MAVSGVEIFSALVVVGDVITRKEERLGVWVSIWVKGWMVWR